MPKRRADETLAEFLDRTDQWDSARGKVGVLKIIVDILQDETVPSEDIRARIFSKIPRKVLEQHLEELDDWVVEADN